MLAGEDKAQENGRKVKAKDLARPTMEKEKEKAKALAIDVDVIIEVRNVLTRTRNVTRAARLAISLLYAGAKTKATEKVARATGTKVEKAVAALRGLEVAILAHSQT